MCMEGEWLRKRMQWMLAWWGARWLLGTGLIDVGSLLVLLAVPVMVSTLVLFPVPIIVLLPKPVQNPSVNGDVIDDGMTALVGWRRGGALPGYLLLHKEMWQSRPIEVVLVWEGGQVLWQHAQLLQIKCWFCSLGWTGTVDEKICNNKFWQALVQRSSSLMTPTAVSFRILLSQLEPKRQPHSMGAVTNLARALAWLPALFLPLVTYGIFNICWNKCYGDNTATMRRKGILYHTRWGKSTMEQATMQINEMIMHETKGAMTGGEVLTRWSQSEACWPHTTPLKNLNRNKYWNSNVSAQLCFVILICQSTH